ncbi:MAG: precorrin-2 C(20)-methyltransferase [Oscillospiraceae bacterium]|nr:precorrin-2 C(20)-methyltransferase [Oscillospiraceae bacterium]
MKGIAYGVGVGPGDPELMTLKAVRLIKENEVIAVPGKEPGESVAYRIAVQAVPEIAEKQLVPINMPMSRDRKKLEEEHRKGAALIEKYLDEGKNVVYITLGDPTVYCTFTYLQHFLEADGYQVEFVSGISSFCAAAARLKLPLAEWDEPLHILPALHKTDDVLEKTGNYVLMKSASHMKDVKELLRRSGREAEAVIDCGIAGEKVCRSVEEIPDDAGYFSLIISKGEETV